MTRIRGPTPQCAARCALMTRLGLPDLHYCLMCHARVSVSHVCPFRVRARLRRVRAVLTVRFCIQGLGDS
eukprot:4103675-Prymnesium_polylepis.1